MLPELPSDVGLTWRALTPDDVPAWFTLTTITQNHDDAIERTSEHELTEQFKGSWRTPARDCVGGFDPAGELRAFAWSEFRPATEGTHAPYTSGSVHPEFRGRGIGTALVRWSEARARQQLAAAEVNLPARVRIFVDEHRADVRALVERCGYLPMRWYSDLRRDLSRPLPEASLTAGVRLEPYSSERAEEIRVTHNEAFVRDHWGSQQVDPEQWELDVTGGESFMPTWSFVAIDTETDRVVGYPISGAGVSRG